MLQHSTQKMGMYEVQEFWVFAQDIACKTRDASNTGPPKLSGYPMQDSKHSVHNLKTMNTWKRGRRGPVAARQGSARGGGRRGPGAGVGGHGTGGGNPRQPDGVGGRRQRPDDDSRALPSYLY